MFYVVMSNRTSACYQAVFKFIENYGFKLQPGEIMTDFETGLRHAIRIKYPNIQLRGCWFHYCQAIRKRLLMYKLGKLIKSDDQAFVIKRQIMNLPLLPPEHFLEGYRQIKSLIEKNGWKKNFEEFIAYFDRYWIKQV